ncbi:hypothetical protein Y032_0069g283 [Ancylostoma ceylanicum]|uniref:Uncharacterized protein n=1 Tax=Ancylostoma ceylanicum TaxID=53326 RepID=A0A016TYA9_9BILA|nr:hypothetical protein Y032_0069g283 [Ancylostoma ceylanicum]
MNVSRPTSSSTPAAPQANYITKTQEISLQTFERTEAQTHSSDSVKMGLILGNYEKVILNAKTLEFLTYKIVMKFTNPYGRDEHQTWTADEPPGIV